MSRDPSGGARGPSPLPSSKSACQFQLGPGLCLDARRALWFQHERVLAVADLHLGYPWAKRAAGQLLPVSVRDNAAARLAELQNEYQAREVVLLGDIIHGAADLPAVGAELRELAAALEPAVRIRWVVGNHDRGLERLLKSLGLAEAVETQVVVGPHRLVHGDGVAPLSPEDSPPPNGLIIMGHEHPVIRLGDGVTRSAKCPCFLVSSAVLILPAFSNWAAGVPVGQGNWMSALAQTQTFTRAIAVVGQGLVPIPLQTGGAR
jgi:putative SbcD/Mre11-related phosphoesterase